MKISFFGATYGVTGSNYMVEAAGKTFLIDCGLFQGDDEEKRLNWEAFPFESSQIDFLVLTHSHIDHIGRVPFLVKSGFNGKIYSTGPTKEFAGIFLEDCAGHMEDEAADLRLPVLFDNSDIAKTLPLFETHTYHEKFSPAEGLEIESYDAGHILGSAIVKITADNKTVIFSGDLGNPPVPILKDTEVPESADLVIMESTYGDRIHKPSETRKQELTEAITKTIERGGTVLMPSFAMERTQEIIYELGELFTAQKLKSVPVFLDSPLAIKANEVYERNTQYFDKEATALIGKGLELFDYPQIKISKEKEQSIRIDQDKSPKVIIAGSGMSNGGRIIHHEKVYLPIPTTTLLIVGFQVKGTLGRRLIDGEKEVKILGENVRVAASVQSIDAYSAHADQKKLLNWQSRIKNTKQVILVHGEPEAKKALAELIGSKAIIASKEQSIELAAKPEANKENELETNELEPEYNEI